MAAPGSLRAPALVLALLLGVAVGEVRAFARFGTTAAQVDVALGSTPRSLSTASVATTSSSAAGGWVYYNFYASSECEGSVTYATGLPMNTCLPANVLGATFTKTKSSAFKVVNATADCSGLSFALYSDAHCTQAQPGQPVNATFTTCRPSSALDLSVSNMLAFKGFCSLEATQLPLSASSFVRSTFEYSQTCDAPSMQTQAFALDSCFGTNEGTSTMYTYSSSQPGHVIMTDYYNNHNCSSATVFQSTVNLSVPLCRNESGQVSSNTSTWASVSLASGSSGGDELSDGAVAGVVVGAVVGTALIAAGAYAAVQSGVVGGAVGAVSAGPVAGATSSATGGVTMGSVVNPIAVTPTV